MILKGVQHTHYSFYSRIAFAVCLRVVFDVDDQDRVLPVILVGFSRGGLVLNQIVVELGTAVYSDALMQRIREIHWLDCANGVSGLCYPDIENGAASFLQMYRYDCIVKITYSNSLSVYFHITSYLYEETVKCERYYELLAFQHQLESIGISVKRRYYSKEFEYS